MDIWTRAREGEKEKEIEGGSKKRDIDACA